MSKQPINSLKDAIRQLKHGIKINDYLVYAKQEIPGRFDEEINIDVLVKRGKIEKKLLIAKIFFGRGYYKPWVELFGISPLLDFGKIQLKYFDSAVENKILELFGKSLGLGSNIYVEYEADKETLYILTRGFAIPISRLGYKLFENGFTWFKDWYFPEGYMEGGRKLQGEKPLDEKRSLIQVKRIRAEVKDSLKKLSKHGRNDYIARALHKAKKILKVY
jgi:hypothetical protein